MVKCNFIIKGAMLTKFSTGEEIITERNECWIFQGSGRPCDGEKCIFQQNKKMLETINSKLKFLIQSQSEWERGHIE